LLGKPKYIVFQISTFLTLTMGMNDIKITLKRKQAGAELCQAQVKLG
jgi:hypothetical protein